MFWTKLTHIKSSYLNQFLVVLDFEVYDFDFRFLAVPLLTARLCVAVVADG